MAYHFWSRNVLILDPLTVTYNLPPRFSLPEIGLLRLQGPDAEVFAQSQLANDVTLLAPGQWQWSCWLNAKGRVLAVLALLRIGEGDLLAILPDGGAAEFGQALQRFVFRRKVTLQVDDRQASGSFASASLASSSTAAIAADGSIELDWGSAGLPRVLRISRDPAAGDGSAPWRQADLRLGLPRLAADQRESWTAQQLGLDRLNGYSVRKGCYPGQEIVARTHFLGKAKRATVLLLGIDEGVAAGSAVLAAEASIGQIACVAAPYALAVLPLEREDLPLSVDGQAVSQLPLLDGLQR